MCKFRETKRSGKGNTLPRVIQVQDRGHRENAADRSAGYRPCDLADGQELDGDLQREQEVHEETVHGLEASNTPHTGRQHAGRQDAVESDVRLVDDDVVLLLFDGDGRAEPAGAGAVGVEETGIDLQCSEGQGGILLSFRSRDRLESRIEIGYRREFSDRRDSDGLVDIRRSVTQWPLLKARLSLIEMGNHLCDCELYMTVQVAESTELDTRRPGNRRDTRASGKAKKF